MFSLKQMRQKFAKEEVVTPTCGPIGVDLGYSKLYLVQLQRNAQNKISLRACAHVDFSISRDVLLASPKVFKSLIREGLKQGHFHGKDVVTALPSNHVRIIPLAYEKHAHGDEQSIVDQLHQRIEGDLNDYVIDYRLLRSNPSDEERLALVVLAKRDVVIPYLELFQTAGLKPLSLDVGPMAIQRLISAIPTSVEETVLVINTARNKSYLTIVSGQRLLLDQEIQFSERMVLDHLSEVLEIDHDTAKVFIEQHGLIGNGVTQSGQADVEKAEIATALHQIAKPQFMKLVESINRVLVFSASETRGIPVSKVYLLGAVARWHGADQLLNSMLNITVVPIREENDFYTFFPIGRGDSIRGIVPDMVKATGYALRGLISHA